MSLSRLDSAVNDAWLAIERAFKEGVGRNRDLAQLKQAFAVHLVPATTEQILTEGRWVQVPGIRGEKIFRPGNSIPFREQTCTVSITNLRALKEAALDTGKVTPLPTWSALRASVREMGGLATQRQSDLAIKCLLGTKKAVSLEEAVEGFGSAGDVVVFAPRGLRLSDKIKDRCRIVVLDVLARGNNALVARDPLTEGKLGDWWSANDLDLGWERTREGVELSAISRLAITSSAQVIKARPDASKRTSASHHSDQFSA